MRYLMTIKDWDDENDVEDVFTEIEGDDPEGAFENWFKELVGFEDYDELAEDYEELGYKAGNVLLYPIIEKPIKFDFDSYIKKLNKTIEEREQKEKEEEEYKNYLKLQKKYANKAPKGS